MIPGTLSSSVRVSAAWRARPSSLATPGSAFSCSNAITSPAVIPMCFTAPATSGMSASIILERFRIRILKLRRAFDLVTDAQLDWAPMPDVYDRFVIGDRTYDFVCGLEPFRARLKEYFERNGQHRSLHPGSGIGRQSPGPLLRRESDPKAVGVSVRGMDEGSLAAVGSP